MTDLNCNNNPEATKEIKLGRGPDVTLVSASDYELASQWKWHLRSGYPVRAIWLSRSPSRRTHVSLHRFLIGAKDGEFVDHVNGDPLDNRRSNLRLCSQLENARNKKITTKTSCFKGVSRRSSGNKFASNIRVDGVLMTLGAFDSEEAAARCYNAAAVYYFGEFARLNPVEATSETWQEISIAATHKYNKGRFSSMYLGVAFNKKLKQWIANHSDGDGGSYLGVFKTELEAAMRVDAAIFNRHGDERPRNFPKIKH